MLCLDADVSRARACYVVAAGKTGDHLTRMCFLLCALLELSFSEETGSERMVLTQQWA